MAFYDLPVGATRLSRSIDFTTFEQYYPKHYLIGRIDGQLHEEVMGAINLEKWKEQHQEELEAGKAFLYALREEPLPGRFHVSQSSNWHVLKQQPGRVF